MSHDGAGTGTSNENRWGLVLLLARRLTIYECERFDGGVTGAHIGSMAGIITIMRILCD